MEPLRCHLQIGPPASGKTTTSLALAPLLAGPEGQPAVVLSTDAIRAEVFGDAAVQGPWGSIQQRLHERLIGAVAAGMPVQGGNLPRSAMRAAMADPSWDRLLPADALNDLRERLRQGHCDLLPASQIAPMARIQLARDQAMARTVMSAWQPGRSVLLLAGNEHVRNDMAVPWHLRQWAPPWPATTVVASIQLRPDAPGPDTVSANETGQVWRTPMATGRDHCQDLRRQLRQSGS